MRHIFGGILMSAIISSVSIGRDTAAEGEASLLDTFMAVTTVRDPEISPDGRFVAYRTFENDFGLNKDMAQLWVVATDGGSEPVQLTYGEDPVSELEWSADSSFLALRRDGKLMFISISGGEPVEVDLGIKGARQIRFAPDGSALFFTAGPNNEGKIKAREKRYGDYDVVREDGTYRHLWRIDMGDGMTSADDPEQLTFGRSYSITGYSVSPDSGTIAFAAWPSPHLVDLLKGRVYTTTPDGEAPQLLDDSYGAKSTPVWHADGSAITYTNSTAFPKYSDVVIHDLGGDASTVSMPGHDADIAWFDDNGIQFSAGVRTGYGLFRLDPSSGNVSRISNPETWAFDQSYSADGTSVAFISTVSDKLGEVAVSAGGETRRLTHYANQLSDTELASKELVTWQSYDGLEIEGVLTKPVGFREGRRYPLFVRTHGGPTGTDRPILGNPPRTIYAPEVLAAEGDGALVLQVNYRGSASYGNAFQTSNLKNLGIGPARDIIAGVEMLVARGLVDREKVACLGWSQGGHISAMLATYSDICTAAIMGAGISDWRTYYYNTDITQFTTEYFDATPLADDAVYARTSPVTYIDKAKTPVLIQHGEKDARVPIANGFQLRQLLLDKGVEARMIVYSGMGHGPSTPKTRRAITEHALSWFREHLFDADKADFVFPVTHSTVSRNKSDKD